MRNIAIIAHVDHGKTTLVDTMLRQSGTFRENQVIAERVMDSNDLEREKGITIMAKNAAVRWGDTKINIVDTPGHSDFGGEVERVLSMVDGVLLLVDAAEGPLPQTRFVLRKALDMGLQPIVVINKIDRGDARPMEVLDEVMELFINLGASYEQLDFPVIYAIGKLGVATKSLDDPNETLDPLFEAIMNHIPAKDVDMDVPFAMVISALDWSDYVGRIAVGRIDRGRAKVGDTVSLIKPDGSREQARITKMYVYEGIARAETTEAAAGEIIALSGFENVFIGETICDTSITEPLSYVNIDEPTIAMHFMVNNSPLAGREGKFVTTPKLRDRLYKELRNNVSLRVEDTESPDVFKVSGRGELQLAILIETMRREGFEFAVSRPEVLFRRDANDKLLEPIEHVTVDVPQDHVGTVIENLGRRKGEMTAMTPGQDSVRCEFLVPARGLIGFRTEFLTSTRGEGILHHTFDSYQPYKGTITGRTKGALVSMETGMATAYALEMVQERGTLFVEPGVHIYEGMIIGENAREEDLSVNACRTKHLTNMRSAGSEGLVRLEAPRNLSLEQCIEFLEDDELLEVTPINVRMRKKILDTTMRQRAKKREANDLARIVLALLVPFFLFGVSHAKHNTGTSELSLRYNLKKGMRANYALSFETEQVLEAMGQAVTTDMLMTTKLKLNVKDVVKKDYSMEMRFDTAYVKATSSGMAEAAMPDSAIRVPGMSDVSVLTTMTSTGEILTIKLEGPEEARSAFASFSLAGSNVQKSLYLVFPTEKVKVGTSWTKRDSSVTPVSEMGEISQVMTRTYVVERILDSAKRTYVHIKETISDLTMNGKMKMSGIEMSIDGEGTTTSNIVIDSGTGLIERSISTSDISARMAMTGQAQMIIPMAMTVKTSMERIP